MKLFTNIRMLSQQLLIPQFTQVRDVVSWMGAVQAQNYAMAKWAVGVRLLESTDSSVEGAFNRGEILRTHVLRPTWHFVAAADIRWMLALTGGRIKIACASGDRYLGIDEALYAKSQKVIQRSLEGEQHLTREQLAQALSQSGIVVNSSRMVHFMMRAEVEGLVCSGVMQGKKQTYALLDERVPATTALHKEEALACLALRYFKSHSPASLQDFTWWSGLSISEARQAVGLISSELISLDMRDKGFEHKFWLYKQYQQASQTDDVLRLLPAFDEYLISYKDRTAALPLEHQPKAFTKNGIFYPVVLHNGRVVGNWEKSVKRNQLCINTTFFEKNMEYKQGLLEQAESAYAEFMQLKV